MPEPGAGIHGDLPRLYPLQPTQGCDTETKCQQPEHKVRCVEPGNHIEEVTGGSRPMIERESLSRQLFLGCELTADKEQSQHQRDDEPGTRTA